MKSLAVPLGMVVVFALTVAACGSSSPSTSTTSTTAIAPAAALATGTYAPTGSSGTPHYVVEIRSAQGTSFDGTMQFVYQDGTSSRVLDFSGTVDGQRATAAPSEVATGSPTQTVSSVPHSLQIAVGSDVLTFEGCQSYLPQALSASACTFSQSR
jgi:hypothetical protein